MQKIKHQKKEGIEMEDNNEEELKAQYIKEIINAKKEFDEIKIKIKYLLKIN